MRTIILLSAITISLIVSFNYTPPGQKSNQDGTVSLVNIRAGDLLEVLHAPDTKISKIVHPAQKCKMYPGHQVKVIDRTITTLWIQIYNSKDSIYPDACLLHYHVGIDGQKFIFKRLEK